MSGTKEIEARLDRSLRNQVAVPRVGKAFDAAVWARIEVESARAAFPVDAIEPSRAVRISRWFALTNSIGIAVTVGITLLFVLRTFGGDAVTIEAAVPMPAVPTIAESVVSQLVGALGQVLGVAALLFGLSFTSVGRRLRATFS